MTPRTPAQQEADQTVADDRMPPQVPAQARDEISRAHPNSTAHPPYSPGREYFQQAAKALAPAVKAARGRH